MSVADDDFSVVLVFFNRFALFFVIADLAETFPEVETMSLETNFKEVVVLSTPIDVKLTFDSLNDDKVLKIVELAIVKFSTFKLSVAKLSIVVNFVMFKGRSARVASDVIGLVVL
jgi:hypothetical protein